MVLLTAESFRQLALLDDDEDDASRGTAAAAAARRAACAADPAATSSLVLLHAGDYSLPAGSAATLAMAGASVCGVGSGGVGGGGGGGMGMVVPGVVSLYEALPPALVGRLPLLGPLGLRGCTKVRGGGAWEGARAGVCGLGLRLATKDCWRKRESLWVAQGQPYRLAVPILLPTLPSLSPSFLPTYPPALLTSLSPHRSAWARSTRPWAA